MRALLAYRGEQEFWNHLGAAQQGNPEYIRRISPDLYERYFGSPPDHCFAAGTLVTLPDGKRAAIETISAGDIVLAFDSTSIEAVPVKARVKRVFTNITQEWLILRPASKSATSADFTEIVVTPGHRFWQADGSFLRIDEICATTKKIVLASGQILDIESESVKYSATNAHLYTSAAREKINSVNNRELEEGGWVSYNFEVDTYHTYHAGNVKVHNDSVANFAGYLAQQGNDVLLTRGLDALQSEFGANTATLAAWGGAEGIAALQQQIDQSPNIASDAYARGDMVAYNAAIGAVGSLTQGLNIAQAALEGAIQDNASNGHLNVLDYVLASIQEIGVQGNSSYLSNAYTSGFSFFQNASRVSNFYTNSEVNASITDILNNPDVGLDWFSQILLAQHRAGFARARLEYFAVSVAGPAASVPYNIISGMPYHGDSSEPYTSWDTSTINENYSVSYFSNSRASQQGFISYTNYFSGSMATPTTLLRQTGTFVDGNTWENTYSYNSIHSLTVGSAEYAYTPINTDLVPRISSQTIHSNNNLPNLGWRTVRYDYDLSGDNVIQETTEYYNGITSEVQYNNADGGYLSTLTLHDVGFQQSWLSICYAKYDALHLQWAETRTIYDDGHRTVLHSDTRNTSWYASYTDVYDASNRETSQTGVIDGGSTWVASFSNGALSSWTTTDSSNSTSWATTTYTGYDVVNNRWSTIDTTNDNGTRSVLHNDYNNVAWYVSVTDYYDASGRATSQTGVIDGGSTWVASFSNGVLSSWTTTDSSNSASWATTAYTGYDTVNNRWSTIDTTNDNGTRSVLHNDYNNVAWYVSFTDYYDASGRETSQTGVVDGGNTWLASFSNGALSSWTTFDTTNSAPWSTIVYSGYDAASNHWASTVVNYDNH